MIHFKNYFYSCAIALFAGCWVSCSDNGGDDPFAEKENALSPIIPQYVNGTVIATYQSLADASIRLYDALVLLKQNKTAENLNAATQAWIASRIYWERSEAFLFGAVADFGIDPHIDTWPLDEVGFLQTLNNAGYIQSMNADDGDVWAANHLGFALLGFHGIEYILFEKGAPKNISAITDRELIYAVAVGGDLRNQCIRLETSWAGLDNVTKEKQTIIQELGLPVTPSNSDLSYGENMLNAGQAGSTYRTVTQAVAAMVAGCIDISDEVGEVKIGTAHSRDDINYIESPYSYNSKVDFADNIRSIENVYMGGASADKRGASISAYIQKMNPDLDREMRNAISNAIAAIDAIPYPFAANYASAQAGQAISACQTLTVALEKVQSVIQTIQ